MIPSTFFRLKLDTDLLEAVSDRRDGVALLSEALANNHATGKYREFIRFFERAFGLKISQLHKKLSQFLEKSDLGYKHDEIKNWISFRNEATHADNNNALVFESDVLKLIPRMEQAAYDILLNKKNWGMRSQERREIWRPKAATLNDCKSMYVTKGDSTKAVMQLFDDFQSYIFYFQGAIKHLLSKTVWSKWAVSLETLQENEPAWASRFDLQVRPD